MHTCVTFRDCLKGHFRVLARHLRICKTKVPGRGTSKLLVTSKILWAVWQFLKVKVLELHRPQEWIWLYNRGKNQTILHDFTTSGYCNLNLYYLLISINPRNCRPGPIDWNWNELIIPDCRSRSKFRSRVWPQIQFPTLGNRSRIFTYLSFSSCKLFLYRKITKFSINDFVEKEIQIGIWIIFTATIQSPL